MNVASSKLQNGWPTFPLGKLCEVNIGRTPSRDRPEYWGLGYPWLSIADMNQGRDLEITKENITDLAVSGCNCRLVPVGTVLLSFKLSIGKVGIARIPLFTNEAIAALPIRNSNKLSRDYLYWALQSIDLKCGLDRAAKGLTLNKAKLVDIEIPFPPLQEQKRIADILDRAEALRAKRRAALAQLDELIKSIFVEMFGDPRSLTKEKKAKLKLREVIDIIVPTRDKPKSFTGNIPWITLPDLANSMYIEDSKYKLSKEEARPTKTRLFPKETVILSCAGSLGKVAIAMNEVYTNQQFYGLVCDKKRIIPEFLAYYLLFLGEDYYRGISGTSTLAFFKKESALNIEIILPDISNQIHFSQIVKQIEKIKRSQQQSSLEINNLVDALMHEAFNGKLFSHQFFERQMGNGADL